MIYPPNNFNGPSHHKNCKWTKNWLRFSLSLILLSNADKITYKIILLQYDILWKSFSAPSCRLDTRRHLGSLLRWCFNQQTKYNRNHILFKKNNEISRVQGPIKLENCQSYLCRHHRYRSLLWFNPVPHRVMEHIRPSGNFSVIYLCGDPFTQQIFYVNKILIILLGNVHNPLLGTHQSEVGTRGAWHQCLSQSVSQSVSLSACLSVCLSVNLSFCICFMMRTIFFPFVTSYKQQGGAGDLFYHGPPRVFWVRSIPTTGTPYSFMSFTRWLLYSQSYRHV